MGAPVFWDVDTQIDFMEPEGALYVPGAEAIIPNLRALTRHARARGIRIVASVDDHDHSDEEIHTSPDFRTTFPPHCIRGTRGQLKIDATAPADPLWIDSSALSRESLASAIAKHGGEIVFRKQRFDVFTNPNVDAVLGVLDPDEVVLYGVALDVCNAHAVEGLLARGRRVALVVDAVRAIDESRGASLIDEWAARGVRLVSTADVLRETSASG